MKGESKLQVIAASSIVVIVISGIWFFGLSDEVTSFTKERDMPDFTESIQSEEVVSENGEESKSSLDIMLEKSLKEKQPELNENIVKEEPKAEVKSYTEKQTVTKKQAVDLVSKIESLENSEFTLKGSGIAYQGASTNSKTALLTLLLKPVEGKDLKEFQIKEGHLQIGPSMIKMEDGNVSIEEKTITINLTQDDPLDSISTLSGSIDELVLDDNDNKQKIHFEKQKLYLGKETKFPYQLTIDATLSHT